MEGGHQHQLQLQLQHQRQDENTPTHYFSPTSTDYQILSPGCLKLPPSPWLMPGQRLARTPQLYTHKRLRGCKCAEISPGWVKMLTFIRLQCCSAAVLQCNNAVTPSDIIWGLETAWAGLGWAGRQWMLGLQWPRSCSRLGCCSAAVVSPAQHHELQPAHVICSVESETSCQMEIVKMDWTNMICNLIMDNKVKEATK